MALSTNQVTGCDTMLIKTDLLTIRAMHNDDISKLHQLLSNKNVMKYVEEPFTYDKTKEFAGKYGLSDEPIVFSVDLKNTGFIGYILFSAFDSDETYEIGWFLLEEHWNKGFASLLTEMLIAYSASIGVKNLVIEFDKNQKCSQIIATKFNFKLSKYDGNLAIYSRRI